MSSHLMIDIETLSVAPAATILTIAAQSFDPFSSGHYDRHFYTRVALEGQENREISEETINWWADQGEAKTEAFAEDNRISLRDALEQLSKIIWQHDFVWSKGSFDFVIIEHALAQLGMPVPWKFYRVRDMRTVLSLWPDCPRPAVSHHALSDCRVQIEQVQATLRHLGVTSIT